MGTAMSQESDISWQVLRRIVQQWSGESAELSEVKPLDGGAISTTAALTLAGGARAVCKLSAHRVDRSYINEAYQLKLLAELGLPVPKVFAAKVGTLDDPFSYILMEFIDGLPLQEARRLCTPEQFDSVQTHLAEILLTMHDKTAAEYGRLEIEPPAPTFSRWPEFFRAVFDPIVAEMLKSSALPVKCRKQIGKIHERLDRLLQHEDIPRLVHWDIWNTNILAAPSESGTWRVAALLDPYCKFAHVEAELAYMSLFQTLTPAFLKTYQLKRRLPDDYHRLRKPVYQIYFLMNHVNLFGPARAQQLTAAVDQLGAMV
jgi:fructosamine-3-kinase